VEKPQDLLALHGRTLPANALDYQRLFAQWITAAKKQTSQTTDAKILRKRLSLAMGAEWPLKVLSERNGENVVLSREGRGDRVPGRWVQGSRRAVLVVHPDGVDAAAHLPAVQDARMKKGSILLIDAFQTGSAVAMRNRSVKHFLAFNQTDDACRAQDILTALAFLKQSGFDEVQLVAIGKAAIWARFAAAVAEIPVSLDADASGFGGKDDEFESSFFVPGIQRAGGWDAARMLTR
jgi:hypothetical protein